MTPVTNGAGHSEYTPEKQDVCRKLHGHLLGAAANVARRRTWASDFVLPLDLTGGAGRTPDGDPGSPLIFAEMQLRAPMRLVVCERNPVALRELIPNLDPYPFATILPGDHNDTVPRWYAANGPKRPTLGVCYFDPNGTESLPLNLYDWMDRTRALRPLDITVNVTATARKRQQDFDSLREELEAVPKRFKFIRKPQTAWHWVFFVATNWIGAEVTKRADLVPLDSLEGQDHLWTATHRRDDLRDA